MSTSNNTNDSRNKRPRTESDQPTTAATLSTPKSAIGSTTKDFLYNVRTIDAESPPSPTKWPARSALPAADWKKYMELVTESLVQNATQEITNIQTKFLKSTFDIQKQKKAVTTLADPEFLPRSIRLKVALSGPDFMKETTIFTTEDEALQNDIKEFQEKVKSRFATVGNATIKTLTERFQLQFIKDLKELAKICFLTLLSEIPTLNAEDIHFYAQAALQKTLRKLTDKATLSALSITHADLQTLATTILSDTDKENFQLHTTVATLIAPAEDNTDEHIAAKFAVELTTTVLLHLAPFLTSTPLKEKQHQIKQQQIKKDIKAYLKIRETTAATEKIDAVLTDASDDKEQALKQLIASETSSLTRKIATLEGQVKQQRKKSTQGDTAKTSTATNQRGRKKKPSNTKSQQTDTNKSKTTTRSQSPKKETSKSKSTLKKKKDKVSHGASAKGGTKEKSNKKKQGAPLKKNSSKKKKKPGKRQST